MQALVQHTADQHEAVTAFLEKVEPVFPGRLMAGSQPDDNIRMMEV